MPPYNAVRRPYVPSVREIHAGLTRYLGRLPTTEELGQAVDAAEAQVPSSAARTWKNYYALLVDAVSGSAVAAGTANVRPSGANWEANPPLSVRNDVDTFAIHTTSYVATDPRLFAKLLDQTFGAYFQVAAWDLMEVGGYMGAGAGAPPLPIFGTVNQAITFQPYIWDEPYIVAPRANLVLALADFSGAPNPARIAFHGARLKPGPAPWDAHRGERIPYWLTLPKDGIAPVIAAANGVLTDSVQLDDQGDFVVTKVTAERSGACLVRLQDPYDDEWFSSDIHIDNFAGNGSFPHRLPGKRLIPSNMTVRAQFTDLTGNPNTFVRLTLHGYRLLGQKTRAR